MLFFIDVSRMFGMVLAEKTLNGMQSNHPFHTPYFTTKYLK